MEQTGSDGDGELNRPEPPVDPGLLQTAETVDTQIKAIRKILASARTSQMAHLPLTPPQLRILAELFNEDGLRLEGVKRPPGPGPQHRIEHRGPDGRAGAGAAPTRSRRTAG